MLASIKPHPLHGESLSVAFFCVYATVNGLLSTSVIATCELSTETLPF